MLIIPLIPHHESLKDITKKNSIKVKGISSTIHPEAIHLFIADIYNVFPIIDSFSPEKSLLKSNERMFKQHRIANDSIKPPEQRDSVNTALNARHYAAYPIVYHRYCLYNHS